MRRELTRPNLRLNLILFTMASDGHIAIQSQILTDFIPFAVMKQILIAFIVFSAATTFSGCADPIKKSAFNDTKPDKEMKQPDSDAESADELPNDSDVDSDSNVAPEAVAEKMAEILYGDKFPEVLEVRASSTGGNKWRFNVTLSSLYDSPQRYADAWRVLDDKDQELGIRVLGHDHAGEQPFTRSETIMIPAETQVVFIEGRDQANGWSGQRFEFQMPSKP